MICVSVLCSALSVGINAKCSRSGLQGEGINTNCQDPERLAHASTFIDRIPAL